MAALRPSRAGLAGLLLSAWQEKGRWGDFEALHACSEGRVGGRVGDAYESRQNDQL